jgi:succinate dehydrogenase / fumarate reductase cytochrome b subunit
MIKVASEKPRSRPLSPHLSVYKLEFSSALSIYHRITGVLLTLSLLGFGLLYKFQTYKIEVFSSIVSYLDNLNGEYPLLISGFMWFIIFTVVFLLSYHISNGLRHLVWDISISAVNKNFINPSSFIVLGLTLVIFIGLLSTKLM